MTKTIPRETIATFARTIHREACNYGFGQVDIIRLVNELLEVPGESRVAVGDDDGGSRAASKEVHIESFPLQSERLTIRLAEGVADEQSLRSWLDDEYGRHFLLSSSTAQPTDLQSLLNNPQNAVGIVVHDDEPIGAVAYLDIDPQQRRAELRKLIGKRSARGQGFAEEATRLWIEYGGRVLGLEKIYVSTLQTHLRNIKLNESIGFKVEGVLQREALIEGERYDVLRMGLCFDEYSQAKDG